MSKNMIFVVILGCISMTKSAPAPFPTDSLTGEAGCSCNGYLDENGEGECNADWPYHSQQFWCYVKEGSCSDAEEWLQSGNFWSYEACVSQPSDTSCFELIKASKEGNISAVKALLSKGCDANVVDGSGVDVMFVTDYNWTPLIFASFNGHHDVVQVLLSQPAIGVDVKSDKGFTALHAAAFKGYTNIVKDLVAGGANVNSVNHYFNWTPLILASFSGKNDVVEILLQHPEIDIETKDYEGYTALISAAGRGNIEVVKTLLDAGGDVSEVTSPKLVATGEYLKKIVTTLKAAGAEVSE